MSSGFASHPRRLFLISCHLKLNQHNHYYYSYDHNDVRSRREGRKLSWEWAAQMQARTDLPLSDTCLISSCNLTSGLKQHDNNYDYDYYDVRRRRRRKRRE